MRHIDPIDIVVKFAWPGKHEVDLLPRNQRLKLRQLEAHPR